MIFLDNAGRAAPIPGEADSADVDVAFAIDRAERHGLVDLFIFRRPPRFDDRARGIEHQYALLLAVAHEHAARGIERQTNRFPKRAVVAPVRQEVAVVVPGLDAVMERLGDPNVALGIDSNGYGTIDDAGILTAYLEEKIAIRVEFLDVATIAIADEDVAISINGDVCRTAELTIQTAIAAPGVEKRPIGGEVLDPLIAEIGDVERPVRGKGDHPIGATTKAATTEVELAFRGAGDAPALHVRAVWREDLEDTLPAVRDPQVAVWSDREGTDLRERLRPTLRLPEESAGPVSALAGLATVVG